MGLESKNIRDLEHFKFREVGAADDRLVKVGVEVENDSSNPIPVQVLPGNPGDPLAFYDEALAVAAAASTNVLTYTVPVGKTLIFRNIHFSGTNYGTYTLKINSSTISKYRTWWTEFSGQINLESYEVTTGLVVELDVLHNSLNGAGDFNATLVGELI